VRAALESWSDADAWPSWAFSNHDAPRAVSRWSQPGDRAATAHLALLLLLCLRGNVFLYQGEELGLPQAELEFHDLKDPEAIANWPRTLGRDGARTPMPWVRNAPHAGFSTGRPWLPVPQEHAALAVDAQDRGPDSTLSMTRRFIALRQRHPALRYGGMRLIETSASVLLFERSFAAERILCVFNLGHTEARLQPPTGSWRVIESIGGASEWTLPSRSALLAEEGTPSGPVV
jgi:alpha-glucosidase